MTWRHLRLAYNAIPSRNLADGSLVGSRAPRKRCGPPRHRPARPADSAAVLSSQDEAVDHRAGV